MVAIGLSLSLASACSKEQQVYDREASPDGRYEIVVYRDVGGAGMPGQSSDVAGTVQLIDRRSGRVLESKRIDMVQAFETPEWRETEVRIGVFATWTLPHAKPK